MIVKVKKFELRFIDENDEEYVEYIDFSKFDKGFELFNSPRELYEARKAKWPELYDDTFLEDKSTMIITEESEMEL
jgi:hypothetical protein